MNSVSPQQLTHDLGGHWHRGRGNAPCPVCQPERRQHQDALSLDEAEGRLLLYCHKTGCGFTDILRAAGVQPGHYKLDLEALEVAKAERIEAENKAWLKARSIWQQGQDINGTHGERYLRGRSITCPLPDTLRWIADTFHAPSGQWCSAMVGNVVSVDGEAMGVHRTFFTKQGVRLPRSAKRMLATVKGGAVRLTEADGALVVCEGLETGLSLASGLLSGPARVWAALSTSGIVGLGLPKAPGKLVIAPDGDDAGRVASNKLATRATGLGWEVSILAAPDGRDWNDVIRGKADAA